MTLLEIVQAAGRRTNKQVSDSDVKTRFIDHVNFARKKAWQKFNWSWKNAMWEIPVLDQITTGRASVVNASRSVVLSSATVSSTQIGWYFQVPGDPIPSWNRVINVSGSTLTLDRPYNGTTNSSAVYYLRGFDWKIPSELEGMPKAVECGTSEIEIQSMLTRPSLIPDTRGKPNRAIFWSNDPIGSTYSTGTLSGTVNTRTLTGSGTSWLANVTAGDQVEITLTSTTYKYHVQSVQSDTSLTLYQFLQTTPAASTYVIRNQFNRYLRLSPTPDQAYIMAIYGQRRFYPLGADNDIDELLMQFDDAILEGVEAYEACSSPDDREKDKYNRWLFGLAEKIGIDGRNFNVVHPAPISLPYGGYRA